MEQHALMAIFFAVGAGSAVIGCLLSFWLGREHAYSDSLSIYRRGVRLNEILNRESPNIRLEDYFAGQGNEDGEVQKQVREACGGAAGIESKVRGGKA